MYASGSGTNTLVFEYTPSPGDGTSDLDWDGSGFLVNGGTVTDSVYGTAADLSFTLPALSASSDIVIDTTPPFGSLSIQGGASAVNTANVNLSITRSGSDVVSMRFSDDGVSWSAWEAYADTKTYTLPSGDGEKSVYMELQDLAGNMSTTITDTVLLDTVAPTLPIVTLSTTAPTDQVTVTIEYSADTVLQRYQLWGDHPSAYIGPFVLTSNRTLSAYATDAAGNMSTTTVGITNIDTIPPNGSLTIQEGALTSSSTVTLLLSDAGTGAAQMRFSDDNLSWSNWETYGSPRTYVLPSGDGVKTVYVQFKDAAGNVSVGTISAIILLDATPPALPVLTPSSIEPAQSVSVSIVYPADAVETTYQINDGAIIAYTEAVSLTSNAVVTAYAKDEAENTSSATLEVSNLDNEPPMGSLVINGGAATTNTAEVSLTLDAGDTGAALMRFSDDNLSWSAWEAFSITKAYVLPIGDGEKTVYVQFMDAAGNMSTGTISATILLDEVVPETISIISAVTDSSGTYLSIRFDHAIQTSVVLEELSLSGTAAEITNSIAISHDAEVVVLYLDQAIQETSEVTLIVGAAAFQGGLGEVIPAQSVSVITPYDLATLKASAGYDGSQFTIGDVVTVINQQIDAVGEPVFDRHDVEFWLELIDPRLINDPHTGIPGPSD